MRAFALVLLLSSSALAAEAPQIDPARLEAYVQEYRAALAQAQERAALLAGELAVALEKLKQQKPKVEKESP